MTAELPHPQDQEEDWEETKRWLYENWLVIPVSDRMALKRMLSRISEVNDAERSRLAELDAEYQANRQTILDKHEKRREVIRDAFRKATGTEE